MIMRIYGDIRELLRSNPPVEPARTAAEDLAGAGLPNGDPVPSHPYAGRNPQELLRLLNSGTLASTELELVREAICIYERFSGERVTGGWVDAPSLPPPPAPREFDPDVVSNPDFDPVLSDLWR